MCSDPKNPGSAVSPFFRSKRNGPKEKKFRIGFKAKINVAASDSKTPIYIFLPSDVKIGLPFSVREKLGDGRHRIRDCLILTDQAKDQAKDQIKIRLRSD